MALFNATELLAEENEERALVCDFLVLPEGTEPPTVTIGLSNASRKAFQQALMRHNNLKIMYRKDSDPEGVLANDPVAFCVEILTVGYVRSEGLFDKDSKGAMLALLKREPGFSKRLAAKLMAAFEHAELFDDDAKKN